MSGIIYVEDSKKNGALIRNFKSGDLKVDGHQVTDIGELPQPELSLEQEDLNQPKKDKKVTLQIALSRRDIANLKAAQIKGELPEGLRLTFKD